MSGPILDSAPQLSDRMRKLAKKRGEDKGLMVAADNLDDAVSDILKSPESVTEKSISRLVGAWARSMRLLDLL